jgi:hypothetical protein
VRWAEWSARGSAAREVRWRKLPATKPSVSTWKARRDLDERAGPDREAEIVALRPRADVQHANQELTGAQWDLRRAEERLKRAETALVAANTRPSGALLPGLLGNEARRETEAHLQRAKRDFDEARRIEQQSLRAYERARHRLEDAERAARQLSEAGTAQERRQSFLRVHPGSRRWIEQLEERVAVRDYELAHSEASERQVTRDGRAGQTPDTHDRSRPGSRLHPPATRPPAPCSSARRDTIRGIGRRRCRRRARWNGRDRALGGSAGASYLPPSTPTRAHRPTRCVVPSPRRTPNGSSGASGPVGKARRLVA